MPAEGAQRRAALDMPQAYRSVVRSARQPVSIGAEPDTLAHGMLSDDFGCRLATVDEGGGQLRIAVPVAAENLAREGIQLVDADALLGDADGVFGEDAVVVALDVYVRQGPVPAFEPRAPLAQLTDPQDLGKEVVVIVSWAPIIYRRAFF